MVLVDNSLSMGYQKLPAGLLLDDAKAKAKEFIEGLPGGSLISVLPTCGAEAGLNFEPYARREEAFEALAAIEPIDSAARADLVIARALKACHRPTGMAGHRILLVTDQQVGNWSADAVKENLAQLPCPMQIEQVVADEIENVWVQDVQLRDGMASAQSPAVFTATIGYEGGKPRKAVPVVLKVDGRQVAAQSIDLQPDQLREVTFPEYAFQEISSAPTSGPPPLVSAHAGSAEPRYACVEVSIGHDPAAFDRLPGDNRRVLVVPVADSLPVVFVDPLGTHEDAKQKIFGDTFWLRRWLAPEPGVRGQDRPLVRVRRMTIDELSRTALADARLVVIAGVPQPSPEAVSLLKQYVEQGGNLLLAAGGKFDPAAWTQAAWQGGLGILPAPLAPACLGYARDDRRWATSKTPPLSLKFESLAAHYFRPEGVGDDYLREALGPPTYFHKIVAAQCDGAIDESVVKAATEYFAGKRDKLAAIDAQLASLPASIEVGAAGANPSAGLPGSQQKVADLHEEREKIEPTWLTWEQGAGSGKRGAESPGSLLPAPRSPPDRLAVRDLAQRARPEVLARYNNDLPMLVRRRWGRGQVLFLTTSLSREWTTLHDLPQSAWLMDRIARCLLAETLTAWNVSSEKGLVLPVAAGDRGARFTLVDPQGKAQPLNVDALGGDSYGIGLNDLTQRGIYHVRGATQGVPDRPGAPGGEPAGASDPLRAAANSLLWDIPVAVNGPADESRLVPIVKGPTSEGGFPEKGIVDFSAQAPSAAPLQLGGTDVWKWLIGLMLFLLLAEFLLTQSTGNPARAASHAEAAA